MKFGSMPALTDEQRQMVEDNLGLIDIWIKRQNATESYSDAFQAATLGLMRAVQKFDPTKGFKFSTYASRWIMVELSNERKFRVFNSVVYVPHKAIEKKYLIKNPITSRSFDDTSNSCDFPMKEKIRDESAVCPEEWAIKSELYEKISAAIDRLPDKKQTDKSKMPPDAYRVIARRCLTGEESHSSLGERYGVSRERIRQMSELVKVMLRDAIEGDE
jgi:RNA polymerase sigma factor (sigma-70 family)